MNISQIKYNLKFGNKPEGKFFIDHHKEIGLSADLLGRYFKYTGNDLNLEDKVMLLIGLSKVKQCSYTSMFDFEITDLDINSIIKLSKYALVFKDEDPKVPKRLTGQILSDTYTHTWYISLETFKNEFELI